MLKRYLPYILLLALLVAGCSLAAGAGVHLDPTEATPTLLAEPTLTESPSATPTESPSATPPATLTPAPTPTPSATATRGPEASYKRLIVIDQDAQTMHVYEDGSEIRTVPVSTGNPNQIETMTPAWEGDVGKYVGTFFAYGTWADDAWYLFEHYGAILIHGAPYLKERGHKVYQELDALGTRPASHGCIRMPPEEATWFAAWGPQGAHVIISSLTRSP